MPGLTIDAVSSTTLITDRRTDYLRLAAIYLLAHLPLLAFFDARFWDDWSVYGASAELQLSIFRQAGAPLTGYFHRWVTQFHWALYPVLTLSSFLAITLLTYELVARLRIGCRAAFWIAAFSAVIPINFARIAIINSPSALLMMLFLASWLILVTVAHRNLLWRAVTLAGFFLSFQLSSLLVPYLLPVAWFMRLRWLERPDIALPRRLLLAGLRSCDLLALPVIYWVFKSIFLVPHGIFAGYNSPAIGWQTLVNTLVPLAGVFRGDGLKVDASLLAWVLLVTLILVPRLSSRFGSAGAAATPRARWLIMGGLIVCLMAGFPYAAVDRLPIADDWTSSRHQITLLLGLPVLLYGLHCYAHRLCPAARFMPAVMVTVLTVNWWSIYAEFYTDHVKQRALMATMAASPGLRSGNFILLDATNMTAFNTAPGPGEYMVQHAMAGLPHDTLLVDYRTLDHTSDWTTFITGLQRFLGPWTMSEAIDVTKAPQIYVLTTHAPITNKMIFSARMLALHVFRPKQEQQLLDGMLAVEGPITPSRTP